MGNPSPGREEEISEFSEIWLYYTCIKTTRHRIELQQF
jgi:hypothetical protein